MRSICGDKDSCPRQYGVEINAANIIVAFVIADLAIGLIAIQAARVNAVDSLRHELQGVGLRGRRQHHSRYQLVPVSLFGEAEQTTCCGLRVYRVTGKRTQPTHSHPFPSGVAASVELPLFKSNWVGVRL